MEESFWNAEVSVADKIIHSLESKELILCFIHMSIGCQHSENREQIALEVMQICRLWNTGIEKKKKNTRLLQMTNMRLRVIQLLLVSIFKPSADFCPKFYHKARGGILKISLGYIYI